MQTIEQELAGKAYKAVVEYKIKNTGADGKSKRDQYGSMALKLPILVRTSGLAEALAFVHSRGNDAHLELFRDLANVVAGQQADQFLEQVLKAELTEYMYLTRRTMLALKWFKRFAQSVLDADTTTEGEKK